MFSLTTVTKYYVTVNLGWHDSTRVKVHVVGSICMLYGQPSQYSVSICQLRASLWVFTRKAPSQTHLILRVLTLQVFNILNLEDY